MKGVSDNDLQFKEFARYVENALSQKGYKCVSSEKSAGQIIRLAYGIGSPQTETSTTTYTTSNGYSYLVGWTWINVPSKTETVINNSTTYERFFILEAYDAKDRRSQLWKITVRSKGSSSDLRSVFPIMVARTFPEFGTNAGWIGSISGDDPTIAEIMRVSSDVHPCDLLHNDSFGGYSIRGVKFIPLTSEFMDAEFMEPFRLSKKEGVLVLDTSWQPPYKSNLNSAKEMGIQTNDIILAVNNKIINNPNVLIKEIQNTEDGGKYHF